MFSPPISPDTAKSTCSPGSADGAAPLSLPDGPPTAPYGRVRARVSRSRSQDAEAAPMTFGTYGPTCFASSVPPGPLSSWESRLRERLATVGSTEFPLIWSEKVTPAGRSISRLAPSMRRTSGNGCIGALWPTPNVPNGGRTLTREEARTYRKRTDGSKCQVPLPSAMAAWPTPQARDGMPPHTPEYVAKHRANGHGMSNLNDYLAHTAAWPTPTVADVQGGRMTRSGTRNDEPLLNGLMMWSTPRASDGEKGGPNQSFGAGGTPLPAQMCAWSTPTTNDAKNNAAPSRFERNSAALNVQMAASGTTTSSSPATTAKRGVPNPEFPCWLMGFPAVWLLGVASATRSRPRLPPKSSKL